MFYETSEEKQILRPTSPAFASFLLHHLKDAQQPSNTLHAGLNWVRRGDSSSIYVTRAGETRAPATSPVYEQDLAAREECVLQQLLLSSFFLVFQSIWSMLICYGQDSFLHAERTKRRANRSIGMSKEQIGGCESL